MASKGWSLLMLMVGVLGIALTVGALCTRPRTIVHVSPQGSAVIAMHVPTLDLPSEAASGVLEDLPTISLAPVYPPYIAGAETMPHHLHGARLHNSGHKPMIGTWNGVASDICRYDS